MHQDLRRIAATGLIAGAAYLAAQAIDLAITRNRVDDLALLGGMTPVRPESARPVGAVMHAANSIGMSAAYHLVVRDRLPGPGWLRGSLFALAENTALYPLALIEQEHPAIRMGRLDSYLSWTAFLQATWRHVAFGAVLGALAARGRR
jgi:hypothetical protein